MWCSGRWRSTTGCWLPPEVRKKRGRILPESRGVWSCWCLSFLAPRAVRENMSLLKPPGVWHSLVVAPGPAQTHTADRDPESLHPFCLGAWHPHQEHLKDLPASAGVPWMLKLCWHAFWSYGSSFIRTTLRGIQNMENIHQIPFLKVATFCGLASILSFAHVCMWLWPQSTFSLVICPFHSTQHCCYIISQCQPDIPSGRYTTIISSFCSSWSFMWVIFFFNHLDNIAKDLGVYIIFFI